MKHQRTESSSNVFSIGFDPVDEVLEARFKCSPCAGSGKKDDDECPKCGGKGHGPTYRYHDVPVETYAAVRDAESVGKALQQHIIKAETPFKFTKG